MPKPKTDKKKEALARLKGRLAQPAYESERRYTAYETPESTMFVGDPAIVPELKVGKGMVMIDPPMATRHEAYEAGFGPEYEEYWEEQPIRVGEAKIEKVGKPKKKKRK